MNIFVLSESPELSAKFQCDKHVNKMILEGVQILNGALYELGLDGEAFYGYTHKNHPCTLWASESWHNFAWLCRHINWLDKEHRIRENNDDHHLSYKKTISNWFDNINEIPRSNAEVIKNLDFAVNGHSGMTDHVLAMPDDCKQDDPVKAYRKYYREYKKPKDWFSYKKSPRPKPSWIGSE